MHNRTLTLRLSPDAAKAYELASPEEQRTVDAELRKRLRELMKALPDNENTSEETAQAAPVVPDTAIHPEVQKISGLIPPYVDAREEYRNHLMKKHR